MSVLPLVFTSGITAYAVVLLLGVFGATGLSDDVLESLQRPEILVTVGVLFLCEAVADKIRNRRPLTAAGTGHRRPLTAGDGTVSGGR